MAIKTVEINIDGIVQGVGFRPFLFNLARYLELKGYILNRGNAGVRLILQGNDGKIDNFLVNIKVEAPKISYIENIKIRDLDNRKKYNDLKIKPSEQGRGISLTLPPDIAICDNCLNEMRNLKLDQYYNYPFIACAHCGPRFTTVSELSYDRERTTMKSFPFCDLCQKEYSDFYNRRFHAQTFTCSICGPSYQLFDKNKKMIPKSSIKEILLEIKDRINNGEIIAIKGIGGVHLVCLADKDDIILELRSRKGGRKNKPFALMIPNLKLIDKEFKISKKEKETITSFRRPIVLLEGKKNIETTKISEWVAPGLNNIGFMLPYSGIHYLLFDFIGNKPLVYTSGNRSNIPMGIDKDTIFEQLKTLADVFLLHNRDIYQRADDSVLRIHDNKMKLIRRSRGYVPEYLPLPFDVIIPSALATGPELAVTGAVLRRNRIFPTQHIGNVSHLETYNFLKNALMHMKNLLQVKDSEIKFIVCDAHPAFVTTKFGDELANQFKVPLYSVQHHFAHTLGLMAENKVELNEKIISICTDGVGYGDDGNIWGGEVLLSSYDSYERLGFLEYQPMIGGDRCTKYPARMLASILLKKLEIEEALKIFDMLQIENDLQYKKTELKTLISQFEKTNNQFHLENIPLTSSTGRIFDVISYILGACIIKTYRGEPAMRLEGLASRGTPENVKLKVNISKKNGKTIINSSKLILDIIDLFKNNKNRPSDIAAKFQEGLALAFSEVAKELAELRGIDKIGLTGGVAYNYSFAKTIKEDLQLEGFKFLEHNLVPPGDAGISSGQLVGGIFQYRKENL